MSARANARGDRAYAKGSASAWRGRPFSERASDGKIWLAQEYLVLSGEHVARRYPLALNSASAAIMELQCG